MKIIDMYFEIFRNNSHRFDTCGTDSLYNDIVIDAGCCEGYFAMKAIDE